MADLDGYMVSNGTILISTWESTSIEGYYPSFYSVDGIANNIANNYFQMRATANPGPGTVDWVVRGKPDINGVQAPSPIQLSTIIIYKEWKV